MIDHALALPEGYQLQEYAITGILGYGGFGITYSARDRNLEKVVAIKEYLPSELAVRLDGSTVSAKSGQEKENFEWGLERFIDEARAVARFNHPNIIRIYRFFEQNGTGYIVMEHIEGRTLYSLLHEQGTLEEAEIRSWLWPIIEGLKVVHASGYIHRDIKPNNIIMSAEGIPILLDFGAARIAMGGVTRSLTSIMTPGYAPLEQYQSKGQGPWTDIYGLAAVMYKCITGEKPQDVLDRVTDDSLAAPDKNSDKSYSPSLVRGITKALAVAGKERPQSLESWLKILDAPQEEPTKLIPAEPKPTARMQKPLPPVPKPERPTSEDPPIRKESKSPRKPMQEVRSEQPVLPEKQKPVTPKPESQQPQISQKQPEPEEIREPTRKVQPKRAPPPQPNQQTPARASPPRIKHVHEPEVNKSRGVIKWISFGVLTVLVVVFTVIWLEYDRIVKPTSRQAPTTIATGKKSATDITQIKMTSEPSDASIFSANEYLGRTPLTITMDGNAFSKDIRVEKAGYVTKMYRIYKHTNKTSVNLILRRDGEGNDKSTMVSLSASERRNSRDQERAESASKPLLEETNYVGINIDSNPPNAAVYIDRVFTGVTPLQVNNFTPGQTAKVVLKHLEYEPIERMITAPNNGSRDFSFTLKKFASKFSLTIETNPPGATVRILNIVPRYQPGMLLEPGRYHVEVSKSGHTTKKKWVEIVDQKVTWKISIETGRIPLLDAKVTYLKFFETGNDAVAREERQYSNRFSSKNSRFIRWELGLQHPQHAERIDFEIVHVYRDTQGKQIARNTIKSRIEPNWTTSYRGSGWGRETPGGLWSKPGEYIVDLYVEGDLVKSGNFTIY